MQKELMKMLGLDGDPIIISDDTPADGPFYALLAVGGDVTFTATLRGTALQISSAIAQECCRFGHFTDVEMTTVGTTIWAYPLNSIADAI